jgi:hypothetical protein
VDVSADRERDAADPAIGLDEARIPGLSVLPHPQEHVGFTLWRVGWAAPLGILVVRTTHLPIDRAWAVLVVVTVWATTAASPAPACLGAGVTWLLGTGFVVHRLGDLTFSPGDRMRLAVTVACAAGVSWLAHRAREQRGRVREEGMSGLRQ